MSRRQCEVKIVYCQVRWASCLQEHLSALHVGLGKNLPADEERRWCLYYRLNNHRRVDKHAVIPAWVALEDFLGQALLVTLKVERACRPKHNRLNIDISTGFNKTWGWLLLNIAQYIHPFPNLRFMRLYGSH